MFKIKDHLILLHLIIFQQFFSQIKLCEENSVMYSKCYTLNNDGSFFFEGNYCGQREIGRGKYSQYKKEIVFVFDSIKPKEIKKQLIGEKNKITIRGISVNNNLPEKLFSVVYKNRFYDLNEDGFLIIDYDGGEIEFNVDNNPKKTKINPVSDNANNYIIYTNYLNPWNVESGTIIKFKKRGKKYKFRDTISVFKEKRDKYLIRKRNYYYIVKL